MLRLGMQTPTLRVEVLRYPSEFFAGGRGRLQTPTLWVEALRYLPGFFAEGGGICSPPYAERRNRHSQAEPGNEGLAPGHFW